MLLDRWKLLKQVMADPQLNPSALRVMFFLLNRENSKTNPLSVIIGAGVMGFLFYMIFKKDK